MAKVSTTILRPGVYATRQGAYEVSAQRLCKYAEKFREMTKLGILVPVCWGHQPAAVPGDSHDLATREYYTSKYNAGYLSDVSIDPTTGDLIATADIPGAEINDGKIVTWTQMPDGRKIQASVGEVSIRVDNWVDGQGRKWNDALVHLGLVVAPVMAGQLGFTELSLNDSGNESGYSLSLAEYDLAAERAPAGGVTINGKLYAGGRFIPGKELANASESEKKALKDAKEGHRDKLKGAVKVDRASMAAHVEPHAKELSAPDMTSAKRTWAGLLDHHGDLALHRLQQMIQTDTKALAAIPPDAEGASVDRLRRRLSAYGAMLKMADKHEHFQDPWKGGPVDHGKVYNAGTEHLQADPARFQFKLNTDKSGVTDELKSIKTFNPDFAGVVSVWRDPADGKTYVVNGHHRYELAQRTGHPNLAVRYIQGKTAKEARATGALINIAEGRGTAVDAAKFMRDMGVSPAEIEKYGISLKGKLAADAATLTNLSDAAFDRVARGTLDPTKALAVAKHLGDHDLQSQLFRLLDKREDEGKDISPKTIEEMAREMAATPTATKTESSLFGDIESEESLFVPRNELKAHVRNEISRQVNDFLAVASKRRAERVGKAGNVLDTDANKEIADESARVRNVFDTLVNRKGPISEAINQGAANYAAAKTKKDRDAIRAKTFDDVQSAVFAEAGVGRKDAGAGGGTEAPPAEPATPAPASPPDAGRSDAVKDGVKGKGEGETKKAKEPHEMTRAEHDAAVEAAPNNTLMTSHTEDWGTLRGQGKRIGPMVVGGMRDSTLQGKKSYGEMFGKLPPEEREDAYGLEGRGKVAYAKSRGAGFSHDHAMIAGYAADKTEGAIDPHRWGVEQALASGKSVPPEVLADYPDLAKKYAKPSPAQPAPKLHDHVEKSFESLMTTKGARHGMIGIADLKDEAEKAAGRKLTNDEYHRTLKDLRKAGKIRLIAAGSGGDISDRDRAAMIKGENELFTGIERQAPEVAARLRADAEAEKSKQTGKTLSTRFDSGTRLSSQSKPISRRRGHTLATNGAKNMADEKDKDDEKDQDEDELFSDEDVAGEGNDETAEADTSLEVDASKQTPEEVAAASIAPENGAMNEVLTDLAKLGVVLPGDTTMANFMERFTSALKTAIHHKEKAEADDAADAEAAQTPPPEEKPEAVTEEQKPIMMSLADCRTPLERSLLAREENRVRKNKLLQIDRLVKRGMPVSEADKLRKAVSGYQLSLKADGTPSQKTVDVKLSTWDMALPGEKFTEEFLLSSVREEPRPGDHDDVLAMKKDIEERAARVSRKVAR